MPCYYIKRALEIQREEGFLSLQIELIKFIGRKMGISRYNPAYVRRRYKFEQKYNGYSTVADPFKIVLVSPKDINRYTTGLDERYWTLGGAGLITNGDWDKEAKFIRDMTKYKAVQKRTQEKIDLEDTGIIDKICYEF